MKKKVGALIITLVVVIVLFAIYVSRIPNYGCFLETRETIKCDDVDVVLVGSSHIYCSINPIQLYDDYGYTSLILARGSQAPWQSYYYVKEAIREYHPEVVVLDTYMAGSDLAYLDHDRTVANMLEYPLSIDKLVACIISDTEDPIGVTLGWPYTHKRYTEVWHNRFGEINYFTNSLGALVQTNIEVYDEYVLPSVEKDEVSEIDSKAEKYLRKSIELCKSDGIEVILLNAPCPCVDDEWQKHYNYISEIAEEYDILFVDGNTSEVYNCLNLNYKCDSSGDGGHLNIAGMTKLTEYFGESVLPRYNLVNHKENKSCSNYDEISRNYHDKYDEVISDFYKDYGASVR